MQKTSACSRSECVSLISSVSSTDMASRRLLHKSATIWDSLPPHLRYTPSCWDTTSPGAVVLMFYLRLENLYTEFLLQKLIVNQDHTSRGALIQTSHQILSLVISVLNKRPTVYVSKVDLEWTVCELSLFVAILQADLACRWSITQCRAPAF